MDDNIFILEDKEMAFERDDKKELLYLYHLSASKDITKDSKTILQSVNAELAQEIESYFNIELESYGVTIEDSLTREISSIEKEEINENNSSMYLFSFFGAVTSGMLFYDYNYRPPDEPSLVFLGWMCLIILLFVGMFMLGEKQSKEAQINTKLKYNIKTKPLPTKDEQLDILEAKIDKLLKDADDRVE